MIDSYELCEVAARVLARIPNEQAVKIDPQSDDPQSLLKHCMFDKDDFVRLFLAVEVYCYRKTKGCDEVKLTVKKDALKILLQNIHTHHHDKYYVSVYYKNSLQLDIVILALDNKKVLIDLPMN
jgi:hypothetical protein